MESINLGIGQMKKIQMFTVKMGMNSYMAEQNYLVVKQRMSMSMLTGSQL